MKKAGMQCVFPLWQKETEALAIEMVDAGFQAILTCVDTGALDQAYVGRNFDKSLIADLPVTVDACGENGEFHTVVTACPIFTSAIPVSLGEVTERQGFVFVDILPINC